MARFLSNRRVDRRRAGSTPLSIAPLSHRARYVIVLAAALLCFARLGAIGLWAPDEPRYAEVAEEVRAMEHGARSWVLLHLNGEAYTQKPPLYFWMAAALGLPGERVSEWAARLPSALAGVALVALLLRMGTGLVGGPSAALAAALLLTTFPFARAARRAQLDVLLALFETLALFAFWRLDRKIGRRGWNLLLFHGAISLGLMTKGPVALLVPLLIVATFLLWERRGRELLRLFPWWSPFVLLGPIGLWTAGAIHLAPAGYFDVAVAENLIGRFFSGTSHARPFYYFAYQFPVLMAPWLVWIPWAIWVSGGELAPAAGAERNRAARFLLAWIGASFVFFSLSSGKRGIYLLPALPAVSLLIGHALRVWTARARGVPRLFHWVTGVLGAALIGACVFLIARDPLGAPTTSLALGITGIAVVVAAAIAQFSCARLRAPLGLRLGVPIAAAFVLELLIFTALFPALDDEKSPRRIAESAAAFTDVEAGDLAGRIGLVGDRALAGGLVYYGARRVAELRSDEDIAGFFAGGGRVVVVQTRKIERFPTLGGAEIRFRARRGRRELGVLTPQRVEAE